MPCGREGGVSNSMKMAVATAVALLVTLWLLHLAGAI